MDKLSLLLVVGFAFLIRIIGLSSVPPSLNWDEVSHGYNAYSLQQSGKDEWGETLPLIFRAYGDYKLPVYIYTLVPFIKILGLNESAVRLPSAIAGALSVLFTYLLVRELFRKSNIESQLSIVASFLMAIEPWSFFLSRVAVEANLALALIIAGIYFFLVGLRQKNWLILISAILLGFSVWTYNSARVFVPSLLVGLLLIYRKNISSILRSHKLLSAVYCLLIIFFFLPMFLQLTSAPGQARYDWIQIIDEGAVSKIIYLRQNSDLPSFLSRLVYNRYTFFAQKFVTNYLATFSPNFLFIQGGSHYQFSVPNHGLLYLIDLPFLLTGLFFTFKYFSKTNSYKLLGVWLLLAPIAGSLTREAPHVLRNIVMLPIPMILMAIGISRVGYRLLTSYLLILLIFFGTYLINYVINYRTNYSWSWQYGYKQVVYFIKANYDQYDKIIVTKKYGEPHEFFLFYWPWSPEAYRTDPNLNRFSQSNWYWVDGFNKFYFVNDWEINKDSLREKMFTLESGRKVTCQMLNVKCLLITDPKTFQIPWTKLEAVNFLDGKTAFEYYAD